MNQTTQEAIQDAVQSLLEAPSACPTAKTAGQTWLDSLGTAQEAAAAKMLVAELEADIMPVDGLLAFANSDHGVQLFGAELAKNIAAHAEELKKQGAQFCDCPACAAAAKVLAHKDALLG